MRWVIALCLVLGMLGGCRHARRDSAGVVPDVGAQRLRRLVSIAARELSCPAAGLSAVPVTDRVYRVTGCGNWSDYAIFGAGRRPRHARWRRIVPIADRVAADLGCPATSVAFTPLSPTAYSVAGCGRTGAFDLRCTDTDCGWVATSPPTGAPTSTSTVGVVIIIPATVTPATGVPLSMEVEGEADVDDEGD